MNEFVKEKLDQMKANAEAAKSQGAVGSLYENAAMEPIPGPDWTQEQCDYPTQLKAVRVPLREKLQKDLRRTGESYDRRKRMLMILDAHPEFELFLELQDLMNHNEYPF